MRVYFRCDANSIIGMGHVMRCLSIADAFADCGFQPTFLLADESAEGLVQGRGFSTIILQTNYRKMEEELPQISNLLKDKDCGWAPLLFVDSYFTTATYLQALQDWAFVVYIDDVLKYPYPVDVLLNYNIFAEEEAYKELYINTGVRMPELLLGTKYVPLRKQFRNLPEREASKEVRNVLISTGGADPNHIALQLAKGLEGQDFSEDIIFHFLLGAMNGDAPLLKEIAGRKKNIILEQCVTDMAGLMTSCDLAVAASGSTLYELCACGVPIINFSFADNQLEIAKKLEEVGVSRYVGDYRQLAGDFCKAVYTIVDNLFADNDKRVGMQSAGYLVTDGNGANEIVQNFLE